MPRMLPLVAVVMLGACSWETPQQQVPQVIVVVITPAPTNTAISSPLPPATAILVPASPTALVGLYGRQRGADEPFSGSNVTPTIVAPWRTSSPVAPTRTPFAVADSRVQPSATPIEVQVPTPEATPTTAPTPFTCGYGELVLLGAGKDHKSCHTPTPVNLYTSPPTGTPARPSEPTSGLPVVPTPTLIPTPTPTRTAVPFSTTRVLPGFGGLTEAEIFVSERPAMNAWALEERVHELINAERVKHDLQPLDHIRKIRQIARGHSEDMANRDFYGHLSPEGDGPKERAERAGYKCAGRNYYGLGENAALKHLHGGYTLKDGEKEIGAWMTMEALARRLTYGWMNSKGHRANILEARYSETGVGIAFGDDYEVYATQNFC